MFCQCIFFFIEEIALITQILSDNITEGIFPNPLYEASIILISTAGKDMTKKKNYIDEQICKNPKWMVIKEIFNF